MLAIYFCFFLGMESTGEIYFLLCAFFGQFHIKGLMPPCMFEIYFVSSFPLLIML